MKIGLIKVLWIKAQKNCSARNVTTGHRWWLDMPGAREIVAWRVSVVAKTHYAYRTRSHICFTNASLREIINWTLVKQTVVCMDTAFMKRSRQVKKIIWGSVFIDAALTECLRIFDNISLCTLGKQLVCMGIVSLLYVKRDWNFQSWESHTIKFIELNYHYVIRLSLRRTCRCTNWMLFWTSRPLFFLPLSLRSSYVVANKKDFWLGLIGL